MGNSIQVQLIDELSAKNLANLVIFQWGENYAQVSRYCAWTDDISYEGNLYTSVPELVIEIDPQHGGAKDSGAKIKIPGTLSPVDKLARPFPHSNCIVSVYECDPENIAGTVHPLYFGNITKVSLGKFSKNKLAELSLSGLKAKSEFLVGIVANSDCVLHLFDRFCKVPYEEYTSTILDISDDGLSITVDTPILTTTTTSL
jgi:hypothetical protein